MFLDRPTSSESIEQALLAQAAQVYSTERIDELRPRIRHLANMMAEIDSHRLDLRELTDPNFIADRSGQ